jgi:RNA polymerase sigma-70 factor (ECF subfamily)
MESTAPIAKDGTDAPALSRAVTPKPTELPAPATSLEQLLREIQPKLTQILGRYRIPAQDADDVLQETFLTLIHKWDVVRNPEAWLVVTLRNRCLIYWRNKRKYLFQAVDTAILEMLSEPVAPHQKTSELRYDLDRLISRLPGRCRSLLRLRYNLGCSSAEMAERMGYQKSSIRKVTSRCLASLTRELLQAGICQDVLDPFS